MTLSVFTRQINKLEEDQKLEDEVYINKLHSCAKDGGKKKQGVDCPSSLSWTARSKDDLAAQGGEEEKARRKKPGEKPVEKPGVEAMAPTKNSAGGLL